MQSISCHARTELPIKGAGSQAIIRGAQARRLGLTLMAVCLSWMALAHADDMLDKNVHFDIQSATLGDALVQFAAQSGVQVAAASSAPSMQAQLPDVTAITPRAPTAAELAGGSLCEFVVHHGTTNYPASVGAIGRGLLRWRGGRPQSRCPLTLGLDPGYNDFVTARVRAIGTYVRAPMNPDLHCRPNFEVLFTTDPEKSMAAVLKWAGSSLGTGYPHQTQKLLEHSANHPIQGWYITVGGGGMVLNQDAGFIGGQDLQALWPLVIPTSMRGNDAGRGIIEVILVIDTAKVAGATIGSIADYAAMVGLSVIQSPDHCDLLPSILDLMAPTCQSREKPAGISAGDLAFLNALYFHDTGLGRTLSRDEIERNMLDQFKRGVSAHTN